MTKQEYLCMALPYKIYIQILNYKNNYSGHEFDLAIGVEQWSECGFLWSVKDIHGAKTSFENLKLVCRPFSDLTKLITQADYNNGEPFVPLIELAKIAYPKNVTYIIGDYNRVNLGNAYSFCFNELESSFICQRGFNGKRWDYECFVNNQLQLFQQLLKWHFPIGLSESDYIPTSKEFNPY